MVLAGCFAALLGVGSFGCDSGPAQGCRHNPLFCGGDVGADCLDDGDCADGFCCTEESNCGGGMCTLACDDDLDCPSFMACEHDMCFFRCESDLDCAEGQGCEHGDTICEWP